MTFKKYYVCSLCDTLISTKLLLRKHTKEHDKEELINHLLKNEERWDIDINLGLQKGGNITFVNCNFEGYKIIEK